MSVTSAQGSPAISWRLAAGFAPPLTALAVQSHFWDWFNPFVWFLFYPAIVASSWIDGLRGALVATLLSELAVFFVFLPLLGPDTAGSLRMNASMTVFALVGIGFGVQQERLRRASRRLAEALGAQATELARSRDRTDEGEALLSAIVSSALDAVISVDEEQRITVFNEAAERVFGCPARAAIGDTIERFLPAAVRGRHRALVEAFGRSGATTRRMGALGVLSALRADGSEFPIEASISQASVGGKRAFTVIIRDVTERLRDEKALRDSVARFRDTLDAMIEGAQILDREWRTVYLNSTAARHARHSPAEMVGRSMMDVYPGFEKTPIFAGMQRCMQETVPVVLESGFTYPDGDTAVFELNMQPAPEGILVLSIDVTERQRANERLVELATLLDQATDAIIVRDVDQRITYWSHGAERLYGWSAEEARGRLASELLYRHTDRFEDAVAAVFRDGEWSGELEQWTRDGHRVLAESRWTLVRDTEGRPARLLTISTDVTERRELERRFLRAQRLESIGTLAGGIAHDLNNVLAPILMAIEVLQSRESDARSRAVLSTIETSARRGADMVRQILAFARGVEGERVAMDVRHVLRDTRDLLAETLPPGIRVDVALPRAPAMVRGDATQLHQVILNLCVNARDAMPGGGVLSLSAEEVVLDDDAAAAIPDAVPGTWVRLAVSDTGVGIPESVKERMFDPFYTTKAPGKGTGLGLATVASIVRSHGGFLSVESAAGQGTTFGVFLPATGTPAGTDAAPATAVARGSGGTVLVVDDEAAVRAVTRDTLETFGYSVLTAADGEEALRVHAQHEGRILAVITDKVMPVLDGMGLIDALRERAPGLPVILASASADIDPDDPRVRALHAFLPKPYTARALLDALASLPAAAADGEAGN